MESKEKKIERIFKALKPNAYLDVHPIWERTRKALSRISSEALGDLLILLWAMRRKN